jgi:flagellin
VQAGIVNATGTAGAAATTDNSAALTIDGRAVTLNQNYASYAALASAIETQMDTAAGSDAYSVIANGNAIQILRTSAGSGSTAVNITAVDADATAAGFSVVNGTAGSNATVSTAASFQVDGTTVTLNQNYASAAALRTAIAGQLSGYSVTGTGNDVIITNNAAGSAAVTVSNADPNAFNSGFTNGAGTAGSVAGAITLTAGELSINGTAIVGNFANRDALNAFINSNVQGVFASSQGGSGVNLKSASTMTLGGSQASALFGGTTFEATNGSLDGLSVNTIAGADDALMRIDSALSVINGARADLGAIQNRFESVIANLGTTVENLSASRSRIRDADYAKETAELTRTQILQQAGTAMLAQANQIPQSVLSLLRQ